MVAQLINTIMQNGKKSLAERIVYGAIEKSRENSDTVDPLEVLHKALDNVRPRLEVKSRRVGGATYQVPIEVSPERQTSLAMRWIVGYANARRGVGLTDALANEIRDAAVRPGQRDEEARRHPPHGPGQPRVCPLPLLGPFQFTDQGGLPRLPFFFHRTHLPCFYGRHPGG